MRNHTPLFRARTTQVLVAPANLAVIAVPEFIRRIRATFAGTGNMHLVVDLPSVTHVEQKVFRLLLWAHGHALSRGGTLAFLAPPHGTLSNTEMLVLQRLHAPISNSNEASG